MAGVPYSLSWAEAGPKMYTLIVGANDNCDASITGMRGNNCCRMNLDKLELLVTPQCFRSMGGAYKLNGKPKTAVWGRIENNTPTLRFTTLGLTYTKAVGSTITFDLSRAKPGCDTMEGMFQDFMRDGRVTFAVMNTQAERYSCCGVGQLPFLP